MGEDSKALVGGGLHRRGRPQVLLTWLLVGGLAVVMAGSGLEAGQVPLRLVGQQPDNCQPITTSVSVPGGGSNLTIAGELCWDGSLAGKQLQILTSGYTYDRRYWDMPYVPGEENNEWVCYDYVCEATAVGYATFHYDRLGTGASDLPSGLPGSMSVANHANVLHQLVQGARNGSLTGTVFNTVVTVGHSMGSAISIYEAGVYGDVDALLLTGNMNTAQPDFTGVPTHPAVNDPKFAGSGLPPEVLTTVPGERDAVFFAGDAHPGIFALDEALKSTGVLNEVITIPTAYGSGIAGNIDVPVLFVVGDKDVLYCNTAEGFPCDTKQDILNRQAPMLPNSPCVDAAVIPNTGHVLNLHLKAKETFAIVNHYNWQGCGS